MRILRLSAFAFLLLALSGCFDFGFLNSYHVTVVFDRDRCIDVGDDVRYEGTVIGKVSDKTMKQGHLSGLHYVTLQIKNKYKDLLHNQLEFEVYPPLLRLPLQACYVRIDDPYRPYSHRWDSSPGRQTLQNGDTVRGQH